MEAEQITGHPLLITTSIHYTPSHWVVSSGDAGLVVIRVVGWKSKLMTFVVYEEDERRETTGEEEG